jgi:hypothetical protein
LTSGTGTVTRSILGTGTRYKIMYLITFIKKKISFTFFNKFVQNYKLFPCKTAYYAKRQKSSKIFLVKFAFYGLDKELEPEPELFKSRNRNFSKVGTGTFSKV